MKEAKRPVIFVKHSKKCWMKDRPNPFWVFKGEYRNKRSWRSRLKFICNDADCKGQITIDEYYLSQYVEKLFREKSK